MQEYLVLPVLNLLINAFENGRWGLCKTLLSMHTEQDKWTKPGCYPINDFDPPLKSQKLFKFSNDELLQFISYQKFRNTRMKGKYGLFQG